MPKKRATVIPTATQEDMQEFVGILARMRNGNETEIPALLASKVEFLLSRDIATLMKRLEDQAADENEMGELQTLFNAVIDFVEQFVGNTAMLSQANGQLLREILEAAAAGMQALDWKMAQMMSGEDPRYTPEFVRFLDAEIGRLSEEVARQKQAADRPTKGRRIKKGNVIDLDSLGAGEAEEEEEEEEEEKQVVPDAAAALQTLSVIKARISTEMESQLGGDAWAAQLLARLLQVYTGL
jgi:hypothetical protein